MITLEDKRSCLRRSVILGLAGFILALSGTAGAVTSSSGTATNGSFEGLSYTNRASVDNTNDRAWTTISASGVAPTGYMGALGRLYRSSGTLCKQSTVGYTTFPSSTYSRYTSSGGCGAGYYYGQGTSYRFNGNGYNAYATFRTPNLLF
jgi:hypothetical protein